MNCSTNFQDIYSLMLTEGLIFINQPIDQSTAGLIISCLLLFVFNRGTLRDSCKYPNLYLNTKSGNIMAALSIVDTVEHFKSKDIKIQTVGLGEIGPAAGLILSSGSKGYRRIATHSSISLNYGSDNFDSINIQDNATDQEIPRIKLYFESLLAKYCSQDINDPNMNLLKTYISSENTLDSKSAIELGLVDTIL